MIGMTVGAVGSERHDDVRVAPAGCVRRWPRRLARVRTVEMLIPVVED